MNVSTAKAALQTRPNTKQPRITGARKLSAKNLLTGAIYGLAVFIGLIAFTYPLFLDRLAQLMDPAGTDMNGVRLTDAPVLTIVLVIITLGVLLVEVQGQAINAKVVAALGILVAVASVLRFLETAIPGPAGFSPIFVPIILTGYVYGARFGLLMGILTLLTSALITGGVGPWLPYQMIAAGWMGMSAGWLPQTRNRRLELLMLTVFAFVWGLLFGAILNLYFWPYLDGGGAGAYRPGESLTGLFTRYGTFYALTSLVWDLARGIGNAAFMLILGIPSVRALNRFRDRLRFDQR